MTKLIDSNCDKTKKNLILTKLKNPNCDKTQKLIVTKLETQNGTKFKK